MWFRHEEGRREGHPPRHRKIVENEKKKKGRRNSKGKPMILFL